MPARDRKGHFFTKGTNWSSARVRFVRIDCIHLTYYYIVLQFNVKQKMEIVKTAAIRMSKKESLN